MVPRIFDDRIVDEVEFTADGQLVQVESASAGADPDGPKSSHTSGSSAEASGVGSESSPDRTA